MQYSAKGFSARVLATTISIPDATDINRAYANNTPASEYGAYGEIAYNIFHAIKKMEKQEFVVFVRYESLDMNVSIPKNGITDGTLNQQHLIAGFNYLPTKNVVVKADIRMVHTGKQNDNLVINPSPTALPYKQNNSIFNLGIGFSF